jgi:LacI family transcriptional regulator
VEISHFSQVYPRYLLLQRWGQEQIIEKVPLSRNRYVLFSIYGLDKKLKAIVKYVSGNVSDNGIIQKFIRLSIGFQTVITKRKPLHFGKYNYSNIPIFCPIQDPNWPNAAQEAGVSQQTISRAINDKGEISIETKERILEIARKMGYRPSNIARSLVRKQTTTIGVIVPDITNPFFSEIVRGVEDLARANSYNVFLCNTDEVPERELSSLESMLEKEVDGVILCSSRLEESELVSKLEEFSYGILVNRDLGITLKNVCTISFDDNRGACEAVSYLVEHGHKKIAFLAGPQRSRSGQKRLAGYQSCLQDSSLQVDSKLVLFCEPSIGGGVEACQRLLNSHPEVTAILCYNDLVAIGAIQACLERGLALPTDLSIIGFDDIPMASLIRPPLTTLRLPKREVGAAAMQMLIEMMDNKELDEHHMLFPPEFILRSSTS